MKKIKEKQKNSMPIHKIIIKHYQWGLGHKIPNDKMVEDICKEVVRLMEYGEKNRNDPDTVNEVIECLLLINALYFSEDARKYYDLFVESMKSDDDFLNPSIIDVLEREMKSSKMMIYNLYLFHTISGKSLLEISFKEVPKHQDIVGSFFSAINSFLSSLLFENCDNSEKVRYIELQSYAINIIPILVRNDVDMVLIHDKPRNEKDRKELKCLIEKLLRVFVTHGKNFVEWDECNVGIFGSIIDPLICNVKEWISVVNPIELEKIIV